MNTIISLCTLDTLTQAALVLKHGGLVAFPTETVYGLGADASNESAINRIFEVKNRPTNHPVIVHIGSFDDVDYWAQNIPNYAIALMRDYWPGPMTLLLERTENVGDFITGGQNAVGLRMPDHAIAANLFQAFRNNGGRGIAAPSANRFGAVSPTSAEAVKSELQEFLLPEDLILDGGPSTIGVESTIIDCTKANPLILRPGAITAEMVEASTGIVVSASEGEVLRVSGSLKQHYSPAALVKVGTSPMPGDGFIALRSTATPIGVIRLAQPKSVEEFARQLYAALRAGDDQKLERIWIDPPLGDGLAIAIRDRINRASE